jgi:hypothetical protein
LCEWNSESCSCGRRRRRGFVLRRLFRCSTVGGALWIGFHFWWKWVFCRLLFSFMEGQGAGLAVRIDDSLIPSFIASFCSTRLENLLFFSLLASGVLEERNGLLLYQRWDTQRTLSLLEDERILHFFSSLLGLLSLYSG